MENFTRLKQIFPDFIGAVTFFTEDYEQVNFISLETNSVEYTKTVTASCGCCSDIEEREANLDWFVDCLSDSDFEELLFELAQKKK